MYTTRHERLIQAMLKSPKKGNDIELIRKDIESAEKSLSECINNAQTNIESLTNRFAKAESSHKADEGRLEEMLTLTEHICDKCWSLGRFFGLTTSNATAFEPNRCVLCNQQVNEESDSNDITLPPYDTTALSESTYARQKLENYLQTSSASSATQSMSEAHAFFNQTGSNTSTPTFRSVSMDHRNQAPTFSFMQTSPQDHISSIFDYHDASERYNNPNMLSNQLSGIPRKQDIINLATNYAERSKKEMVKIENARSQWQAYLDDLSAEKEKLVEARSKAVSYECRTLQDRLDQLGFESSSASTKSNSQSNQNNSCIVCENNPKQIVFQCGHQCCFDCSARLEQCHTCRAPITNRIRLYD